MDSLLNRSISASAKVFTYFVFADLSEVQSSILIRHLLALVDLLHSINNEVGIFRLRVSLLLYYKSKS